MNLVRPFSLRGTKMRKSKRSNTKFLWFCIAPAFILFTVFLIIPTINVFSMSLFKWGGLNPEKTFYGLKNFKILFKDVNFIRAMQNTIFLIVFVTIITIFFALLFSFILSRTKVKGKSFFRIVFYLPNILSIVVIGAIFQSIYQPEIGVVDTILDFFNLSTWSKAWLADSKVILISIGLALIWQAIGYYMVMYMASMSSVPDSLYEAADLEGCSNLRKFFDITLPLVWDVIRTTLAFFIISTINLSFLIVNVMTQSGPDHASEVILGYLYNQAYGNSAFGYGMAIGTVVFIFSFVLSALVNKVTQRDSIQF